jgi:hypothetical protein
MEFMEARMVTRSAMARIDEAVPPFRKSILKLKADILELEIEEFCFEG